MESKMHGRALKRLFQMARENRSNATPAEEILWNYLKTKPFGIKFRRQPSYSVYILDFYCHSLKLIIEVDGSIHNLEEVKKNDFEREKMLKNDGFSLIRFTNDEVFCSLEKVKDTIIF